MTLISKISESLTFKLQNLYNFHPLEVVDRVRETQIKVDENSHRSIWRPKGQVKWGTILTSPWTRFTVLVLRHLSELFYRNKRTWWRPDGCHQGRATRSPLNSPGAGSMLGQRRRRWPNIEPALAWLQKLMVRSQNVCRWCHHSFLLRILDPPANNCTLTC